MKKLLVVLICLTCFMFLAGCENNKPPETDNESNKVIESATINPATTGSEEQIYETFNPDEYETAYKAALIYYTSCPHSVVFEEGDTIHIDKLMGYYKNWGMFKWGEPFGDFDESLNQYKKENGYEIKYHIPKDIVTDTILKHFSVELDTSNSEYSDPDNEERYIVATEGWDGICVSMNNIRQDGDRVTADYIFHGPYSSEIYDKKEICIENPDSEDFRIIYVRDIT